MNKGKPYSVRPSEMMLGIALAMTQMVEGAKWELYLMAELQRPYPYEPEKEVDEPAIVMKVHMLKCSGEMTPLCNVKKLKKCTTKEKDYVKKQRALGENKMKAEMLRLGNMLQDGDSITPEKLRWLSARVYLLTMLTNKISDGGDDDEL